MRTYSKFITYHFEVIFWGGKVIIFVIIIIWGYILRENIYVNSVTFTHSSLYKVRCVFVWPFYCVCGLYTQLNFKWCFKNRINPIRKVDFNKNMNFFEQSKKPYQDLLLITLNLGEKNLGLSASRVKESSTAAWITVRTHCQHSKREGFQSYCRG